MTGLSTIKDYEDLKGPDALSLAERKLIAACRAGQPCRISDTRPESLTPETTIRSELLAFLISGKDASENPRPHSLLLMGANIVGVLDLSFTSFFGDIRLRYCVFHHRIRAIRSKSNLLSLKGSHISGLTAEGAEFSSYVYLTRGFKSTGQVSFAGARIMQHLDCTGGSFESKNNYALYLVGLDCRRSVFLRDGFNAEGGVILTGAKIGGQLSFSSARMIAKRDGHSLFAQNMQIGAAFIWKDVKLEDGSVYLSGAHAKTLQDDLSSWPGTGLTQLVNFKYEGISQESYTNAESRIAWLSRVSAYRGNFSPQPYTQLAKVLSSMGHNRAARVVLIERERQLGSYSRTARRIIPNGDVDVALASLWADIVNVVETIWDITIRITAGYGYSPTRSLVVVTIFLFGMANFLASSTWKEGSFVPNSDVILTSSGWQNYVDRSCLPIVDSKITTVCDSNPASSWANDPRGGLDWEGFNPTAYALDLVVPVLNLGQTSTWSPSRDRGPWGYMLWFSRWWFEIAGWVIATAAAGLLTGQIKPRSE